MKVLKFIKSNFLLVVVLVIVIVSYHRVPSIFFQQDEILGFGQFIKEGWNVLLQGFGSGRVVHFIPFTMSLSYSIYKIFGINHFVYNSLALLLHLANGFLIYKVGYALTKNRTSSAIATMIFFSSNIASELVMWPVINLNAVSLTFALLSWLIVINKNFLKKVQGLKRGVVLALLFLLSVFSVEYSAGMALFIPLVIYLNKKIKIKEKMQLIKPFFLTFVAYFSLRFIPIVLGKLRVSPSNVSNSIPSSGADFVEYLLLIPKYLGQLTFGQKILLGFSRFLQIGLGLGRLGPEYAELNIYPVLITLLGLALLLMFGYFIHKNKKKISDQKRLVITTFSFIVFSSFPFVLVPGGPGLSSVISSRYMYFGLAGFSLLVATVWHLLSVKKKFGFKLLNVFIFIIVILGVLQNYQRGNELYQVGKMRQDILTTIISSYPKLYQKTVFYAESNISYYGLTGDVKTFPFQSGLGQTLLVFYSQKDKLPLEFYPGKYLWEIDSQGYFESKDRGFGFYRDFDLMKEEMSRYNISTDSVIAFSWNGKANTMEDISAKVKGELKLK